MSSVETFSTTDSISRQFQCVYSCYVDLKSYAYVYEKYVITKSIINSMYYILCSLNEIIIMIMTINIVIISFAIIIDLRIVYFMSSANGVASRFA